jgi:hypothetical protein
MVFLLLVVFGFSTKPLTMIRLFAELSGHYPTSAAPAGAIAIEGLSSGAGRDASNTIQPRLIVGLAADG